jgi:hypothetical protein
MNAEERFWSHVATIPEHPCYEWTAYRTRDGYGVVGIPRRRTMLAHRYAWELERGPIPDGKYVCHTCDNPGCVRVDHLFLGTHTENMADATRKGRNLTFRKKPQTHCKNGHEMVGDNVYTYPTGQRCCRICATEWRARRKASR